jgi:hypothetical protein
VKDAGCVFVTTRSGGRATGVASLAVSFVVFVSPPPLAVAVFVTVAGAVAATSTVSTSTG